MLRLGLKEGTKEASHKSSGREFGRKACAKMFSVLLMEQFMLDLAFVQGALASHPLGLLK